MSELHPRPAGSPERDDPSDPAAVREPELCPACGARLAADLKFCQECGNSREGESLVGSRIDERYEVVRKLGEGAMGAVYQVRHLRLDKRFAMKVIRSDFAQSAKFVERFEREALATSKLEHPHCIAVTDYGKAASGELYLVMEFLKGQQLSELLGKPLPVSQVLDIVRQMLLGLGHAHRAGLIHRDVKPENVILLPAADERRTVKLLDFGIAVPAQGEREQRITDKDMIFGTPAYMAPEQAIGDQLDARGDLYSVGAILFEMLTGRPVFQAGNPLDLLQMKLTRSPPSLDSVAPGVFSRSLAGVVERALARDRQDRFTSADEFLQALARIQRTEGGGLSTRPANPVLRAIQPLRELYGGWYRCAGAGEVSWTVRLKALVTTVRGGLVLGSSLALCGVLVLAVVFALGSWGAGDPTARSGGDTAAGAGGATAGSAKRLARVRHYLAKGNCREAALEAKNLARDVPKLAAARYFLGASEMCRGKVAAGLAAYRRAITLSPRYRTDARLLEDVASLLAMRKRSVRLQGLRFLAEQVGKPALEQLLGAATSEDPQLRRMAVAALVKLGAAKRVDWITVLHQDLRQLDSCEQRAEAVEKLRKLGTREALSVLLDARSHRRRSRCIRDQLDKAIAALRHEK